jgi:ribosomal protein S13
MVVLFNKDLENKKFLEKNLQKYYGIGIYSAKQTLLSLGVTVKTPTHIVIAKKTSIIIFKYQAQYTPYFG